MAYSRAFRELMIEKMTGPEGRSASSLAPKVGVTQETLSKWLREAGKVGSMPKKKSGKRRVSRRAAPPRNPDDRRPQDFTAEEKLAVVMEAASMTNEELGAFLRKKGLHEAQLEEWRKLAVGALSPAPKRKRATPETRRKQFQGQPIQRRLRLIPTCVGKTPLPTTPT